MAPPATSWAAAPAGASLEATEAEGQYRAFLPSVAAPPPGDPCAPPARAPWGVRCGGFGRIRDLYGLEAGGALAVGDGAAVYRDGTWAPQLGVGLWGLAALALDDAETSGWAVGEGDRIARLRGRRWSLFRPDERNPSANLTAVSVHDEDWAAGEEKGHAALRVLRFENSEEPRWVDLPDQAAALPPISDIFAAADSDGVPGAWAVGSPGPNEGAFLRPAPPWRVEQRVSGVPEELALTSLATGWAFGDIQAGGSSYLAFWRLNGSPGPMWMEDPQLRRPGGRLLDAYQSRAAGRPRITVGVEPAGPNVPVAYVLAEPRGTWEPLAWPDRSFALPPSDPAQARAGNRGIAPLVSGGGLLFAWDDAVWLYRPPTRSWTAVRRRRDFHGIAAGEAGAWLLDPGARDPLVLSGPGRLAPAAAEAVQSLPLVDLGGSVGAAWALVSDGSAVRLRGALGRWERLDPPAGIPPLARVAGLGVDEAWAVGINATTLALAHFAAGGWRLATEAPSDGLVPTAVAAYPGGWAWATAAAPEGALGATKGVILGVAAGCVAPCNPWRWPFAVPLRALTASGPDEAWAAGEHVLVRCRGGTCLQQPTSPAPNGARFVALAAGDGDDLWAVAEVGPAARAASVVFHFDGRAWLEACRLDVAVRTAEVVAGGDHRVLWLAGDWSTVVRHEYAPADPVAGGCSS